MDERVVIITGASHGIGRATALHLAREGAALILNGRVPADLEAAAEAARAAGGRAEIVAGDASDTEVVEAMVAAAQRHFGGITGLVTCAGLAPLSGIEALDTETFDALIAINVRGPYLATRAVWPVMVAGGGGAIVHVSSMAASDPFPGFAAYGGSKAFINTFVRGLAAEGQEAGIRVYAVAPGAVDTRMLRGLFPDFPTDQRLAPSVVADTIVGLITGVRPGASGDTVFLTRQGA